MGKITPKKHLKIEILFVFFMYALRFFYARSRNKVAHSKYTFAKKIYDCEPGFDNFDLSNFALILDIIKEILFTKLSGTQKNTT